MSQKILPVTFPPIQMRRLTNKSRPERPSGYSRGWSPLLLNNKNNKPQRGERTPWKKPFTNGIERVRALSFLCSPQNNSLKMWMFEPGEFLSPFQGWTIFSLYRGLHPLLYPACPSGIKGNIPIFLEAKQMSFLKYKTDTKYFRWIVINNLQNIRNAPEWDRS